MEVQAQDLRVLVNGKGKVGFADSNGNEVIKCEYESARPFVNGVAIVTKSDKSGLIDTQGNVLLPVKYQQIVPWFGDLYLVQDDKKVGLVNNQGTTILPVTYSFISKPNCYGKALIATGGKAAKTDDNRTYMANAKYGIIGTNGEILVEAVHKGLYEFANNGVGYFPFYEGKHLKYSYHCTTDTLVTDCKFMGFTNSGYTAMKGGIIDERGNVLVKADLYSTVMLPQNDMVRYYNRVGNQTACGYYNLSDGTSFVAATFNGSTSNLRFWSHGDFIGGIAPVNGNTWSFIDKKGNVLRSGYSSLKHSVATGLWAAKNSSEQWEVFDWENKNVDALSGYNDVLFPTSDCGKELFGVGKEGKYGCILRDGTVAVPIEYEYATGNTYGMMAVKKNGKWGMLSENNTELIPTSYQDIIMPEKPNTRHIWVMKEDSLYYHVNFDTKTIANTGYKSVANFQQGIALVIPASITVEDTQYNRAQVITGKATLATLANINLSKLGKSFGYLINTDDVLLTQLPVSVLLKDRVTDEIIKRGGHALNKSETKRVLLKATENKRSYELNSVLDENEWDY